MKILCLGDSLTFGFGVHRRDSWTTLVKQELGLELINRGIPGDTTGGMLARFPLEVEKHRPALITIMGGLNDIFFGQDDVPARANIAAMVHQSTNRNIIPLLCTPVPVVVESARKDWAGLVDFFSAREIGREYAEWLHDFAETFAVPFIDFWEVFEDRLHVDGTDAGLYVDGLHPNAGGQKLMAEMMVRKLRELLPQ